MTRHEGPNDRWLPAPPLTGRLRHHARLARALLEDRLRGIDGMAEAAGSQPLPARELALVTYVLEMAGRALARSPIPHKFVPRPGTPLRRAQAMLLLADATLAIRCHFKRSDQ